MFVVRVCSLFHTRGIPSCLLLLRLEAKPNVPAAEMPLPLPIYICLKVGLIGTVHRSFRTGHIMTFYSARITDICVSDMDRSLGKKHVIGRAKVLHGNRFA
eukprot:6461681-Amphidinium_carterae.1